MNKLISLLFADIDEVVVNWEPYQFDGWLLCSNPGLEMDIFLHLFSMNGIQWIYSGFGYQTD